MKNRKKTFITGAFFIVTTFLIFYYGVGQLLNHKIDLQNLITYSVFSFLIGLVAGLFVYYKAYLGFSIFTISYIIGFRKMILSFNSGNTGWENLNGLLEMFIILGIGTGIGAIVEIIKHFINKSKDDRLQ